TCQQVSAGDGVHDSKQACQQQCGTYWGCSTGVGKCACVSSPYKDPQGFKFASQDDCLAACAVPIVVGDQPSGTYIIELFAHDYKLVSTRVGSKVFVGLVPTASAVDADVDRWTYDQAA